MGDDQAGLGPQLYYCHDGQFGGGIVVPARTPEQAEEEASGRPGQIGQRPGPHSSSSNSCQQAGSISSTRSLRPPPDLWLSTYHRIINGGRTASPQPQTARSRTTAGGLAQQSW